jgi:hypothetical protein
MILFFYSYFENTLSEKLIQSIITLTMLSLNAFRPSLNPTQIIFKPLMVHTVPQ